MKVRSGCPSSNTKVCMVLARPVHAMMTSSNGNIFRVTGHLCGEFIGHQ